VVLATPYDRGLDPGDRAGHGLEADRSRTARMKQGNGAERPDRGFLTRSRVFTGLDPACGSGHILDLALPRQRLRGDTQPGLQGAELDGDP